MADNAGGAAIIVAPEIPFKMEQICAKAKNPVSFLVNTRSVAPIAVNVPTVIVATRNPSVSKSQHNGKTKITKVIVPQFAIIATVASDHL